MQSACKWWRKASGSKHFLHRLCCEWLLAASPGLAPHQPPRFFTWQHLLPLRYQPPYLLYQVHLLLLHLNTNHATDGLTERILLYKKFELCYPATSKYVSLTSHSLPSLLFHRTLTLLPPENFTSVSAILTDCSTSGRYALRSTL